MKKTACMMVCVVLIVLFAVPFTFGQALDGQWFQMKVSHKGYGVNPGGIYKISAASRTYMYLTWMALIQDMTSDSFELMGAKYHRDLRVQSVLESNRRQ